ncbi:MAG: membrane protein insertase YidC [Gemmatimonadaceae bacterium]|nr:membrane protein insertase YidC [Gemmatimonadaceae bacterium]
MEPRRIALAVVLMAMVLVVSQFLFPTAKPVPGSAPVATDSLTQVDSASAARISTAVGNAAIATTTIAPPSTATASVPDTLVALPVDTTATTTTRAVYRTTNRGAALIGAQMTQFPTLTNRGRTKGDPAELANAGDPLLSFRLVVPGDTVRLDRQTFRTTRTDANGQTVVRYDATVAARAVAITYTFLPDSYRVNVAAEIADAPTSAFLLVDLPPSFHSSESDTTEDHTHLSYAYKPDKRNAKGIAFRSVDPGERQIASGPLTWAVAKSKYFLVGLLMPAGQTFAELDVTGGVRTAKQATRAQATAVLPLTNGTTAFEVYAGPQEFKRLVAMGREFETSNPYGGWLQGVVQPFATIVIRLLLWMKATLGLGYGWILVLFGVAVRLILWPLNQKAMRSSMAMQRLQPELQAIQAKHKGDPQKLQVEMMRVYKEHGMSPFSSLSGCLPMLIPLPVFFALFFVFQNTIEFRGVSFLWLPDISVKDPYFVLPVLVAATAMILSFIGMKGVKANEQQKMMMYMMPAMMLFIFFSMASGLNLYYLVQNLASLPQQWLIAQERGRAVPVVKG